MQERILYEQPLNADSQKSALLKQNNCLVSQNDHIDELYSILLIAFIIVSFTICIQNRHVTTFVTDGRLRYTAIPHSILKDATKYDRNVGLLTSHF